MHALPEKRDHESASGVSLLHEIMPEFDFGHRHAIVVTAPPAVVAAEAEKFRLTEDGSFVARLLFRLRGLTPRRGALRDSLTSEGFTVLAEKAGEEIVAGVAGRFWALDERSALIRVQDARAFVAFREPGTAKAAVSFRFEPLWEGAATRLSTETRVQCADAEAYRRFFLYWLLIKPFSEWLRRDMLRAIERRALERII